MEYRIASNPTFAIAAALLLATQIVLAQPADHYVLERGRGVEVCEAFEANLLAEAPEPVTEARMCPIPVDSTRKGFEPIDWIVDFDTPTPSPVGISLPSKIDNYLWQRGVNPVAYLPLANTTEWKGTPKQIAQAYRSFVANRERAFSMPAGNSAHVVVDVDNDGAGEPIFHDNRNCMYSGIGAPLIVLKSDYADIDRAKTDLLMVHPPRAKNAAVFQPDSAYSADDAVRQSRYDLFRYRHTTYITQWGFEEPNLQPGDAAPIHVYLVEQGRRREVCTYRYRR